ncbi:kinase-like protein [Auricularia subglabra TFB-10046 SS5]|nr:kinase-like protein [Auricularia subglabra TFB-10046 SS5]
MYVVVVKEIGNPGPSQANVLISDFGEALLADFGLSTFLEKANATLPTMTAIRRMHTAHFAAPELFLGASDTDRPPSKTCESDIYAFGMLILEVCAVTERPPWNGLSDVGVVHRVSSGRHPSQPKADGTFVSLSHAWWEICRTCWTFEPNSRPTMQAVLRRMRVSILDLQPQVVLTEPFSGDRTSPS